jgi:hypothetical protein
MFPFLSLTKSCCHARTEESDRDIDGADDGTAESAGRVTNNLVNIYAQNNPDAPELNLDDCTSLTDEVLWAISTSRATGCCIEKLSIRNCRAITDTGLLALADSKVKIGEIDTRGVEQLTLVAVTRLLFDCGAKMLDNLPAQLEHKATGNSRQQGPTVGSRENLPVSCGPTNRECIRRAVHKRNHITRGFGDAALGTEDPGEPHHRRA